MRVLASRLANRFLFGLIMTATGVVYVTAQDEPSAGGSDPPPAAEIPTPVPQNPPPPEPAPVPESPPSPEPAPPEPAPPRPVPVPESPAPERPAAPSTVPAPVPDRPAPVTENPVTTDSPPRSQPAVSPVPNDEPASERPSQGGRRPEAGTPRPDSPRPEGRNPADNPEGATGRPQAGNPAQSSPARNSGPRGEGRNDSRRPQLGISIGPGGVQVFRGDPGFIPGPRQPLPGYYGRNSWGHGPQPWSQNSGWGIAIDTRPVVVQGAPVIVAQPQQRPPNQSGSAPAPPSDPPVPTPDDLAGIPSIELRGLLLYSVDRLNEELGSLSTGSSWQKYLRTADLKRLVPPPTLAPLPPDATAATEPAAEPLIGASVQKELREILLKFDSVEQDPEFRTISRLWGFQTTRAVLRELQIPPVQRQRKQLTLAIELLEQELQQFETGATWKSFLKLADLNRLAEKLPDNLSRTDRQQFHTAVSAFDSVSTNPQYRMISDLLGFRQTLYLSRSLQSQLEAPAPPAPVAPAAPVAP